MVPYLRAANVKDGRLELSSVHEMNFMPNEQRIFSLQPGDVLVTEGSGSLASVGASAVWRGELPGTICFQNTLLRLRPRPGTDARFLAWWCRYAFAEGLFSSIASGANIFHISAERVRALSMAECSLVEQLAIADFLDAETARIDIILNKKVQLLRLLSDRIDAQILERIGSSDLVQSASPVKAVPISRILRKLNRPITADGAMVTAFRDGQVTARSARRAEGFTEAWGPTTLQGVRKDDVVIHGLDGFAGAVGASAWIHRSGLWVV